MGITVTKDKRDGITIFKCAVTVDASGDATDTFDIHGEILKIFADIGTLTNQDITLEDSDSGEDALVVTSVSADTAYYTKRIATLNTGGALTSTGNIYANYVIGKAKLTIANGTASKSGDIYIWAK